MRILYAHSDTALEVSARESVTSGKNNDEMKFCHVSVSKMKTMSYKSLLKMM